MGQRLRAVPHGASDKIGSSLPRIQGLDAPMWSAMAISTFQALFVIHHANR
jgi:hypothetical protein